MNDPADSNPAAEICLIEEALPGPLFDRLVRAVRSLGNERMTGNGSYTTNFWFPRGAGPTNVAEEAIVELIRQVDPGPECIGTEWWLGRLGYGKQLRLHFDRDLVLNRETGQTVHPLLSSVLYLNAFPSSPTLILDQVLGPDGKEMIPEKAEFGKYLDAVPNHYVVFPGNLRHGVVPDPEAAKSSGDKDKNRHRRSSELRLTLLVNYWHRRPLPPVCSEYDGTIYASLRNEVGEVAE